MGGKNDPCYRVVAADSRTRRDGPVLENLGWYDPTRSGQTSGLKLDRVQHWIDNGAEVSETVQNVLKNARKSAESATPAPEAEAQNAES
jgi:small subunit ribosomal protein S16